MDNKPSTSLDNIAVGLLVGSDQSNATIVQDCLAKVAIASEWCRDAENCLRIVSRRKFEVVFVDFALGEQAITTIEHVKSAPSTRTAVVVGITANPEQSRKAFSYGAQFVVEQPVTISAVEAVLKAAYGLIVRERRRYFRCTIEAELIAHRSTEAAWTGQLLNISEGGLCMLPPHPLSPGESLHVDLRLPNTSIEISAHCDVQWSDVSGRVGLKFVSISSEAKSDLQCWLSAKLEAAFPVPPSLLSTPVSDRR